MKGLSLCTLPSPLPHLPGKDSAFLHIFILLWQWFPDLFAIGIIWGYKISKLRLSPDQLKHSLQDVIFLEAPQVLPNADTSGITGI
jgi:hypothetical protein